MQFPSQPDEGYSEDPLNPTSTGSSATSTRHDEAHASRPGHDLVVPSDLPAWLERNLPYLPVSAKTQLAMALLDHLPTSVVAQIAERLHPRLYINFIQYLPPEVCLKILGYLDPVSLLGVAQSCREWYSLALDRKLWEKLYHMEGWQALYPEIRAWEDRMNENANSMSSSVSSHHHVVVSEDGHTCKKRGISEDDDQEMVDADRLPKPEGAFAGAGGSIFGTPGSVPTLPSSSRGGMDVDASRSSSKSGGVGHSPARDVKGKGKAVDSADDLSRDATPTPPSFLSKPSLWSWDPSQSRYKLNWKHVYTLRRKLEANWEQGKFTNFQLPRPDHPEEGHQECIYTLQFDAHYLVSGSRDRTIRIWKMNTRRLLRAPLKGHEGSVLCLQFDADPEEDLIVSGSSDSNVILWRFSTGEIIQRLTKAHSESVLNVKFDKRILVTCSKDKSIKIFNRRPLKYGDLGYPNGVNPVPIRIRDNRYGNPTDDLPIIAPYTMIGRLDGHGAAVNAVQIHGNEVVSASGDRNIKVWDWAKQVCTRTVVGHTKGIACVQYDGRRIVSGSSDNEVKVFDCLTGLEVASLRAHSHLVRTVQAGFGDLPYSEIEDKAKAKKIDEQYFKALESGAIEAPVGPGSHRTRPRNAGSSRPEDITAYGATLPPGGGGGKYARIVSGSYDQKIIIWRRLKEGEWVVLHRLRQEEAAEAAQSWAATSGSIPVPAPASTVPVPTAAHPPAPILASFSSHQPFPPRASTPGSAAPPQAGTPQSQNTPSRTTVETPIIATVTPESTSSYMAMIDMLVPQGAQALQQALATYPTMLVYHTHIQAAITREPSPVTRTNMRQVVAQALHQTQEAQARTRLASVQNMNGQLMTPVLPPLASLTGTSSSTSVQAAAGSSTASTSTAAPSRSSSRPFDPARHLERHSEPPQGAMATAQSAGRASSSQLSYPPPPQQVQGHLHIQGHGAPSQVHQQPPVPPSAPVQHHSTPVPQAHTHAQAAQNQPTQAQTQPVLPQPTAPPANNPQQPADAQAPHHPHIHATEGSPARVFKLQFDARRIICCSQTSVIVGWDFCNGDAELEEVSRIFGTIE
ncbi:hypothetical protein VD0004_g9705 [Verticillium dahliae]|nr:hypothetical protein VD0004_g9705 [Verticillium dahliae]PNH61533.1 hypothetical protein VD0001_g9676 [Verticillium dahliae]